MPDQTSIIKTPVSEQDQYLVWIDMEMTGLNPKVDHIIEIATLITDGDLNLIAEGPELIIHQEAALFDTMDDWCKEHHTKSGLWEQVLKSKISLEEAERQTLQFIQKYVKPKTSPLCGNTVWQDRRFLYEYMPKLEDYLHYRIIDVSTLKELAKRWYDDKATFKKESNAHRALADIKESVEELKHYRAVILR